MRMLEKLGSLEFQVLPHCKLVSAGQGAICSEWLKVKINYQATPPRCVLDDKMAVTTQPRANRKETENFVKELDPQTVQGTYKMIFLIMAAFSVL